LGAREFIWGMRIVGDGKDCLATLGGSSRWVGTGLWHG
jgi:hypothetical protein